MQKLLQFFHFFRSKIKNFVNHHFGYKTAFLSYPHIPNKTGESYVENVDNLLDNLKKRAFSVDNFQRITLQNISYFGRWFT